MFRRCTEKLYWGPGMTWICFLTCWATVSLTITLQDEASSTVSTSQCLAECICLSFTQVLCNTGGLHEIPNGSLPLTVEDLSLTKNNFPIIRREAFTAHRYLRKLTLDGNNISSIKPFAFRGLPHLRELSIQHTPLSYVGQYSFAALQNITMLVLAHNKIRYIEGYSFAGTDNVKLIFLSNNPLVTIQSYAFSGLKNVERLILPSGIKEIESDAFNNLQHIGLLKLTYMDLKRLLPYTFRALSYVHVLNIQESDLGVIHKDAFTGLRRINNLNILNNKIDAIKQLNLSADNEIGTFRFLGNHILEAPRAGDTILDVGTISALNNHFPCDCQIHNVLESDFVNGSTMEFQLHNFCISPIEFNGKPMSVVDFDGIARCHEKVFKDNLGSRGQDLRSTLILITFFLAVGNFF